MRASYHETRVVRCPRGPPSASMFFPASRLALITPEAPFRPSLWLELTDDQGRTGLGEASPLAPFSSDNNVTCASALANIHARLAPLSLDVPPAEAIVRAIAPIAPALAMVPAARFALETALLDLLGQRC